MGLVNDLLRNARRLRAFYGKRIPPRYRGALSPDDLVQESWEKVFRYFADESRQYPANFDAWLIVLAKNLLLNTIKQLRAGKRGGGRVLKEQDLAIERSFLNLFHALGSSELSPSKNFSVKESIAAVRLALAQLPDHWRDVMWMFHIEGKSIIEIAEQVGKTPVSIKGVLARARSRFREELGSASSFFTDVDLSASA